MNILKKIFNKDNQEIQTTFNEDSIEDLIEEGIVECDGSTMYLGVKLNPAEEEKDVVEDEHEN